MTLVEFCAKVEWEGGVIEALTYGLKESDLDGITDPLAVELREIWTSLTAAWEVVGRLEDEAGRLVDSVLEERDEADGM